MHGNEKRQIRETVPTINAVASPQAAGRSATGAIGNAASRIKNQAKAAKQARREAERRNLPTSERRRAVATLRALRQIEPSAERHVRAAYSDSTPDWKIPPIDRA